MSFDFFLKNIFSSNVVKNSPTVDIDFRSDVVIRDIAIGVDCCNGGDNDDSTNVDVDCGGEAFRVILVGENNVSSGSSGVNIVGDFGPIYNFFPFARILKQK
jgi:hypothetical protein